MNTTNLQYYPLCEYVFDKTVEYLTPTISCLILQALEELQKEQNPPYSKGVFLVQIRQRFSTYKLSTKWLYTDAIEPVFTSLVKLSQFYCDKEYSRFSMTRIDENWFTFQETIQRKFPGYKLGSDHLISNVSDITINMDELLALFRSKDIGYYNQVKDKFFGKQSRYTTANAVEQQSVMYATYPRSGNSLMRKYFENLTGVATGSDMVMKHGPNVALQHCGFKGEGMMDERCWIKKSHYPMRFHFMKGFESEIAVICTRNPLDISPSLFYLAFSWTHVVSFREKLVEDPMWANWKLFQKKCTEAWNLWHNYWIDLAKNTEKPIYFFRFEDVMANPRVELHKLMKFILGMDDLTGTVIEQRIEDVLAMGTASTQVYKPRQGGSNKNLQNYTQEQLDYVYKHNEQLIHYFGYAADGKEDNVTPFFDYKGKADPDIAKQQNGYLELNKKAFQMRKQQIQKYGKTPPRNIVSAMPQERPGEIKMIRHFEIFNQRGVLDHATFV